MIDAYFPLQMLLLYFSIGWSRPPAILDEKNWYLLGVNANIKIVF
jgi:hypothetical protein